MWKLLKKALSFHLSDVVGLLCGVLLITKATDTELFYLIINYRLYVVILLLVFLIHSWIWLFGYHGENAYIKHMLGGDVVKDFFRVSLACVSAVGIYFFYFSLLA